MDVAESILQAMAEAPGDRTPALVLADWLEEHDTPAARELAPLVRLAAGKRTPAWRKQMRAARERLAKERRQAAGWFDWWFGTSFGPTFRLIQKPDRLALTRFGVRCIREVPAAGHTIFELLTDERILTAFRHVERFLAGELLAEEEREAVQEAARAGLYEAQLQGHPSVFPAYALDELCNVAFPKPDTKPDPLYYADGCARYCLRAAYEAPPVPRHTLSPEVLVLGLLRATVPCPFDPEGDGYGTAAERKYLDVKRAVEAAGFFAPHVQIEDGWERLVCASKHRKRQGYTGIIAFVTEAGGDWYIATPHPQHYRVRDPGRVAQVVVTFLGQDRRGKAKTATGGVDLERELLPISPEEFEQVLPGA
jgi:uncharacterized protein (TIGR02996 family)